MWSSDGDGQTRDIAYTRELILRCFPRPGLRSRYLSNDVTGGRDRLQSGGGQSVSCTAELRSNKAYFGYEVVETPVSGCAFWVLLSLFFSGVPGQHSGT